MRRKEVSGMDDTQMKNDTVDDRMEEGKAGASMGGDTAMDDGDKETCECGANMVDGKCEPCGKEECDCPKPDAGKKDDETADMAA
jgi:hypothetical protein